MGEAKLYRKEPFVCVAGKNNIAVDVLDYLIKKVRGCNLGVVCNKTETGQNSFQKSLRWFAEKNGIKEYMLEELYHIDNLIFLSMEFDRLIKPEKFKNARLYNIHFSLLPQYKGMYTSALPILNGESQSGVTLHRIDAGIDTGEVIDQEAFSIDGMTCREVYLSYIKHGIELVLKNIKSILAGTDVSHQQGITNSTYYSKEALDYGNIAVNFKQTAEGIARQIRAFNFREYQLPEINGRAVIDYAFTYIKSDKKPGKIVLDSNEACMVATVDYNIILYYDHLNELLEACRCGNLPAIYRICAVKRHINDSDEHGWTPLITAVYYNQKEAVKFLLTQGADIHAVNHNGTTLLMYAKEAYRRTKDATLFSLFCELGVSRSRLDYNGHSLLDYCIRENIEKIGDYRV